MTPTARILCLLLLTALAIDAQAGDHQLPGRVLRVIDGDSLVLDVRGGLYQVELAGIDAPELNQPWGSVAGERLRGELVGAFVVVDAQTGGGREVLGTIRFKGRDLGLQLVGDGLAWSLFRAEPDASGPTESPHPYALAEQQARAARRGLWADDAPIPPWQWRRGGQLPDL
jgi:endonuclease YncB( thermonuclease family)